MVNKTLLGGIIGFMLGGLVVSSAYTFTTDENTEKSGHSQVSKTDLNSLKGEAFDKAFIDEMIVHHEGAIDMAEQAQSNAKHTEIKDLSREIISAQTQEIRQLQKWQADWGYKNERH